MIDPFTAPGTSIVCIDDEPSITWGPSPLKRGAVYTIDRWENETYLRLVEFPKDEFGGHWMFSRELFARPALPAALTSLLDTTPAPVRELEPA